MPVAHALSCQRLGQNKKQQERRFYSHCNKYGRCTSINNNKDANYRKNTLNHLVSFNMGRSICKLEGNYVSAGIFLATTNQIDVTVCHNTVSSAFCVGVSIMHKYSHRSVHSVRIIRFIRFVSFGSLSLNSCQLDRSHSKIHCPIVEQARCIFPNLLLKFNVGVNIASISY